MSRVNGTYILYVLTIFDQLKLRLLQLLTRKQVWLLYKCGYYTRVAGGYYVLKYQWNRGVYHDLMQVNYKHTDTQLQGGVYSKGLW